MRRWCIYRQRRWYEEVVYEEVVDAEIRKMIKLLKYSYLAQSPQPASQQCARAFKL
jgi:hypothetical protein